MEQTWNEQLRYEYQLNPESIVLDIGGFEGDWAAGIYAKYQCWISVFEPVKEFYDIIKGKLQELRKVHIHNFGLGTKDETLNISLNGMSTSILITDESLVSGMAARQVEIRDIVPLIFDSPQIDLVKINIEGAEYDLLDHIIANGLQTKFGNIQIQFHMNVADHEARRQAIRSELAKTHHLTYDFAYTHENWEMNT